MVGTVTIAIKRYIPFEICDGLDNDCSERPLEVNSECYDDDGDGYCEVPPCINTTSVEPDCNERAVGLSKCTGIGERHR